MSKRVVTVLAGLALATPVILNGGAASSDSLSAVWYSSPERSSALLPGPKSLKLTRDARPLAATYTYQGKRHRLDDFLTRSSTEGLLVLRGDTIVGERYLLGTGPDTLFGSWSVAKSITSAAVGIALAEGRIHSVDDPVTQYVPRLRGSGFDGVRLRDVLNMASGIRWDEVNYPFNDAGKAQARIELGTPAMTIARETKRAERPGTRFNYASINTYVLGEVVSAAVGQPLNTYIRDKIWRPAGMADTAHIAHDRAGRDLAFCCVNATLRDFGRFGLLYLNEGRALGRQVVPRRWVRDSTRADKPYLQPHVADGPDSPYGYGYQWWPADGSRGDYAARGILGQMIYVSPKDGVVIVKTSRDVAFSGNWSEALAAFRTVASHVAD